MINVHFNFQAVDIMGAFFWDYSGYSYSGLGITKFQLISISKRTAPLKQEYPWQSCPENYYHVCGHVGFPTKTFLKLSQKNAYSGLFCLSRVNLIPFILFILLSGAE